MEKIQRPQKVRRENSNVLTDKNSQENTQIQFETIYDYLDKLLETIGADIPEQSKKYSYEEHSVGEWIEENGTVKKLYSKTVNIGQLPNATMKTVKHNIENLDKIISFSGFAKSTTGYFRPLPSLDLDGMQESISISFNYTDVIVECKIDRSSYTESFVILEYTKN